MNAILLSIGDELALGQTVDTNSAWLAARLARLGVKAGEHHTLADDAPAIAEAVTRAAHRVGPTGLILITGGLGPTDDDLTREALAAAMGEPLIQDPASVEALDRFFAARGREMPRRNRVQAMHPRGSSMLDNPRGTAPGIRFILNGAVGFVMPGVPREMQGMFDDHIVPWLDQRAAQAGGRDVILTTTVHTFGQGESDVAELLGPLMQRDRNPTVGTTVANGVCSVRIRSEFRDNKQAQRELEATAAEVEARLGSIVYGRDEATLQESTLAALIKVGLTVATAESCTGGLCAAMLTDVPGSSRAVTGGFITYTNGLKTAVLGVDPAMIQRHGAVSEPVAAAMAEGAMQRAETSLAVAITGIAGPDGGTREKPVGTVCFALAARDAATAVYSAMLPGERAAVRDRSAKVALQLLRLHTIGESATAIRWLGQR